ncbi:MAG TPA: hypothetical protein PLW44_01695 [Chitinophagales bacterium]|nr:hypothetical protein [Chitinophagales bacterium]
MKKYLVTAFCAIAVSTTVSAQNQPAQKVEQSTPKKEEYVIVPPAPTHKPVVPVSQRISEMSNNLEKELELKPEQKEQLVAQLKEFYSNLEKLEATKDKDPQGYETNRRKLKSTYIDGFKKSLTTAQKAKLDELLKNKKI